MLTQVFQRSQLGKFPAVSSFSTSNGHPISSYCINWLHYPPPVLEKLRITQVPWKSPVPGWGRLPPFFPAMGWRLFPAPAAHPSRGRSWRSWCPALESAGAPRRRHFGPAGWRSTCGASVHLRLEWQAEIC